MRQPRMSKGAYEAKRGTHEGGPALGNLLEDLALAVRVGKVDVEVEAVKVVDDLALHRQGERARVSKRTGKV
jgi:hypothetical protein